MRLPFYGAALLSLINLVYGYFVLPESLPKSRRTKNISMRQANPLAAFTGFTHQPMIVRLVLISFFSGLAFQALLTNWNIFLQTKFDWGAREIGLLLMFVGIIGALVQGGLMNALNQRFGEWRLLMIGLLAQAIEMFTTGGATVIWVLLAGTVVGGLMNVVHPTVSSLASQSVGESEQGAIQGAIAGIDSVAGIVGPLLSAWVFDAVMRAFGVPDGVMHFGGIMALIAAGVLWWTMRPALATMRQ